MALLGSTTLQLSLAFCGLAFVLNAMYLANRDGRFFVGAQRGLIASSLLILIATFSLVHQLMVSNFSVEYVARYSSAATPTMYKFAGLWAGMEGSLLFWLAILGIYVILVNYLNRARNRSLMPIVNVVMAIVMLFFLMVTIFFENPFTMLPEGIRMQVRGMGLNPLLQHPVMLIHPPMLYLGYVGFVVPFAFAVAALTTRRLDATWVRSTRRWTLLPWLFLAIGIILGGRWAYVELGWGGYWAWDPVENASFLPWLTGTAYLHSVIIQEKKNMLRLWNVILIMATFTLTIFGTYLTRSGILSSVHAFAGTELGIWFFGFVMLIIVACVILVLMRKDELASRNRLESFTSRESGFLFNNMIFVALALAVLWGTMFPILSEAVRGTKITVGSPYFDRITTPIGLILLLMIGIGPLLAWRRTSIGTMRRNFTLPMGAAIVVAAVCMLLGIHRIYPVLAIALVAFVLTGIVVEVVRGIGARRRTSGESSLRAFLNMVDKNRSRYGGAIVHLGVLLMFVGFVGKAFTVEQDTTLRTGESTHLQDYVFTLEKHYTVERSNHTALIADIAVSRADKLVTVLKPEKRVYTDQNNQPNSEVAIYSKPLEDLYALVGGENPESGSVVLKIMINPLVQMVWLGGIILTIGTIVAIWPSRTDRRLREKRLA
ncbi:MAG: heme lyase CcmF/NrfE family subunit [Fidelibacterota bacterium]|nr:MAG: heme lyase CcmF/NrfE family subunit [Candidatus Neomarinimicrobiota bacterium]